MIGQNKWLSNVEVKSKTIAGNVALATVGGFPHLFFKLFADSHTGLTPKGVQWHMNAKTPLKKETWIQTHFALVQRADSKVTTCSNPQSEHLNFAVRNSLHMPTNESPEQKRAYTRDCDQTKHNRVLIEKRLLSQLSGELSWKLGLLWFMQVLQKGIK